VKALVILPAALAAAFLLCPCPAPAHAADVPASRADRFFPWWDSRYPAYDPDRDSQETMRPYRRWTGLGMGMRGEGRYSPLDQAGAARIAELWLRRSGKPGLVLAGIKDLGAFFAARVTARDGTTACRLLVDKDTGAVGTADQHPVRTGLP
jgi:hypothetical protein